MTPLLDFQKAMNDTLVGLGYTVFDYRPVEEPFPYILIGGDAMLSSMTKTMPHFTMVSTLEVFSKYMGNKEAKMIIENIISNCDTKMVISGWKITNSKVVSTAVLNDTQPDVIHGVVSIEYEISKI